ncbi:MAG: hypothetical protein QM586_08665 [Xenophilus sp.]
MSNAALIDCKRTGIGLDAAAELVLSARACGLPAVVRSHSRDALELISPPLDAAQAASTTARPWPGTARPSWRVAAGGSSTKSMPGSAFKAAVDPKAAPRRHGTSD